MDFDLTEEQRLVRDTARDFAAREIAPKASEIDKSGRWPAEIVAKMGELGFLGMAVPEEYGGAGMDNLSYSLVMEEISAACASCGVIMSVNNSLFCDPIYKFGTDAQKKEVLTACASGKKLGCFGLTEPMSGSDAQTMATNAEKTADGCVVVEHVQAQSSSRVMARNPLGASGTDVLLAKSYNAAAQLLQLLLDEREMFDIRYRSLTDDHVRPPVEKGLYQ